MWNIYCLVEVHTSVKIVVFISQRFICKAVCMNNIPSNLPYFLGLYTVEKPLNIATSIYKYIAEFGFYSKILRLISFLKT